MSACQVPELSRLASWQCSGACLHSASATWSASCCGRRSKPCLCYPCASPSQAVAAVAVPTTWFGCCDQRSIVYRIGRSASPNRELGALPLRASRWRLEDLGLDLDPDLDGFPRTFADCNYSSIINESMVMDNKCVDSRILSLGWLD